MIKPIVLLVGFIVVFELSHAVFGYGAVYQVGYGAFSVLAAVIAGTFFWLWAKRSTPLALGMAFGWAGSASLMAWWWVFDLLDWPDVMIESWVLFVFLSVYFVGAVQHLEVIGRSFGLSRRFAVFPIALALAVSLAVRFLI
jgi:hypothetical protein